MDFFAGVIVTSLVVITLTLWSAAPYPTGTPLGYMSAQRNGWVDLQRPGAPPVRGQGSVSGNTIKFDVYYAVIYWPRMGYRQVILTRIAGKPLHPAWKMNLISQLQRWFAQERLWHPKWAALSQTLTPPPDSSYALYDAYPTPGLGLRQIK